MRLDAEWVLCRDWLLPALEEDTEAHVLEELRANRAQLWRGDHGAIVTQLKAGPEPHLCVWLGGGKLHTLMALAPGLMAWGRMHGATEIRINGRMGWRRLFPQAWRDGDELRMAL